MAELLDITSIGKINLLSKNSVELFSGRGLFLIDVNAGAQTIVCLSSYWSVEMISSQGASIISVTNSEKGQYVKIVNDIDEQIFISYRRYGLQK